MPYRLPEGKIEFGLKRIVALEVCYLVEEALQILLKAEADADLLVTDAKSKSHDIIRKAELSAQEEIDNSVAHGKSRASAMAAEYGSKAAAEMEAVKAETAKKIAECEKKASVNKAVALKKAMERIVRANGHR